MSRKSVLRMKEGDVFALAVGDGKEALLRLLFRWRAEAADLFWVYPEYAWSIPIESLAGVRAAALLGVHRAEWGSSEAQPYVQCLGHCPLTPRECQLPFLVTGGTLWRRDRVIRHVDWDRPDMRKVMARDREKFFDVIVSMDVTGAVMEARYILGLKQDDAVRPIQLLKSYAETDRCNGAVWLSNRGYVAAAPAIPLLMDIAQRDRSNEVRRAATHALGRVGHDREDVRETLIAVLRDADPEVREAAKAALQALVDGHYWP